MNLWTGILVLALAVVGTVLCVDEGKIAWKYQDFPNPTRDVEKCGRQGKISNICDPSRILRLSQANQLDNLIMKVVNTTECPCAGSVCEKKPEGYHIAIALVDLIKPQKHYAGNSELDDLDAKLDEAKMFAYGTMNRWNTGRCNDDIIIFFSKTDNVIFTMTGEKAKEKLQPGIIGEISINNRKFFDDGKYFEGLQEIIKKYQQVLTGQYKYQPMHNQPRVAALTSATVPVTYSPLLLLLTVGVWWRS